MLDYPATQVRSRDWHRLPICLAHCPFESLSRAGARTGRIPTDQLEAWVEADQRRGQEERATDEDWVASGDDVETDRHVEEEFAYSAHIVSRDQGRRKSGAKTAVQDGSLDRTGGSRAGIELSAFWDSIGLGRAHQRCLDRRFAQTGQSSSDAGLGRATSLSFGDSWARLPGASGQARDLHRPRSLRSRRSLHHLHVEPVQEFALWRVDLHGFQKRFSPGQTCGWPGQWARNWGGQTFQVAPTRKAFKPAKYDAKHLIIAHLLLDRQIWRDTQRINSMPLRPHHDQEFAAIWQ